MSPSNTDNIVNNFVHDNLSPKFDERAYIDDKYLQLKAFLNGSCFRSGSYARYTANHPVHDLDVIFVVDDPGLYDDPAGFMQALKERIENSPIEGIKSVQTQTHSLVVTFSDSTTEFSVDIVPAIDANEWNEYRQPLYIVPEIIEFSGENRTNRYALSTRNPIEWIKTNPKGYVKAAQELNKTNKNFRHVAKLLKAWRHAAKKAYKDEFKLKSFHLEQMIYHYFFANPEATTSQAVTECLEELPGYLSGGQFVDRADPDRYIDSYIDDITEVQRSLIISLQADAYQHALEIPTRTDQEAIENDLSVLLTINEPIRRQVTPMFTTSHTVTPKQPWCG